MRWVWLTVAACHADVCERDEQSDLDCGRSHPSEETRACQDDLQACTGADLDTLAAYQDCYEASGAQACEPSADAYLKALDCKEELDGLSDGCLLARPSWTGA